MQYCKLETNLLGEIFIFRVSLKIHSKVRKSAKSTSPHLKSPLFLKQNLLHLILGKIFINSGLL